MKPALDSQRSPGFAEQARTYLRRYGDVAVLRAAQIADAALDCGDLDAKQHWQAVVREIERLETCMPAEGIH